MQVFVYTSEKDDGLVGYTKQRDGLPASKGPWKGGDPIQIERGDGLAGVGPADPVIDIIEQDGYCIAKHQGGTIVQRDGITPRFPPA